MTPEQEKTLQRWIYDQFAALKAKGATEADLQEPAFMQLVAQQITQCHLSEQLETDPELVMAVANLGLKVAGPDQLRALAAKARQKGNNELASDLELLADQKERGVK